MNTVKDDAKKIIENLPENATWDDLMYQLYVKKKIETSLKEAAEGNIIIHEDVKKRVLGNAN